MDRPGIAVRRPTQADADAMAEVHNRGWREAYAHLLPESFYDEAALERRRHMWRRVIERADGGSRLALGESGGTVVGVALAGTSLGEEPVRDLELYTLYVVAEHYGTGVGQALLDTVLGRDGAQLWVARDNPRARAFYRRNGFVPDGAEKVDTSANDLVEVRLVR